MDQFKRVGYIFSGMTMAASVCHYVHEKMSYDSDIKYGSMFKLKKPCIQSVFVKGMKTSVGVSIVAGSLFVATVHVGEFIDHFLENGLNK